MNIVNVKMILITLGKLNEMGYNETYGLISNKQFYRYITVQYNSDVIDYVKKIYKKMSNFNGIIFNNTESKSKYILLDMVDMGFTVINTTISTLDGNYENKLFYVKSKDFLLYCGIENDYVYGIDPEITNEVRNKSLNDWIKKTTPYVEKLKTQKNSLPYYYNRNDDNFFDIWDWSNKDSRFNEPILKKYGLDYSSDDFYKI